MTSQLTPGLVNLGGVLVENYERDTRATAEAKIRLGLDPIEDSKASIGIAAVGEYAVFRDFDIPKKGSEVKPILTRQKSGLLVMVIPAEQGYVYIRLF